MRMTEAARALRSAALATAVAVLAVVTSTDGGAVRAQTLQQTQEEQIGRNVELELEARGEILPADSAGYAVLGPVARRIAAVVDPQADVPFRFVLIHEEQPNAFAVPGGSVYVTDSLLGFVQNADELAAVLCHEASHELRHDALGTSADDTRAASIVSALGGLAHLNRSVGGVAAESLTYRAATARYSRSVERAADAAGAVTCAAAGYNPWGMIWLFTAFASADTGGAFEALSDHPTDDERIADLEDQFRGDPETFAHFSPRIASATPLR